MNQPIDQVQEQGAKTQRLGDEAAARVQKWSEDFGDGLERLQSLAAPKPAPWWAFWRYGEHTQKALRKATE